MKITIDKGIPFIEGVFEPYAEVTYKEGSAIEAADVRDADALIIRTRTKCNSALLDGSKVKIIATATIGTDNINLQYCKEHGIFLSNATGCNAGGVMNYVFSALYGTAARKSIPLNGCTFGIVGVGNTGARVEKMARALGFKVLLYDPIRAEEEGASQFCELDELLENSDVVSLHIPLNDSTRGIADAGFFASMKPGAFFINTAHGELVVDDDLIYAAPRLGPIILDVWNNEPDINPDVMDITDIATPHIAGYSYQGKLLGTREAVRSVARYFKIEPLYEFFPQPDITGLDAVKIDLIGKSQGQITSIFQYNYPVFTDDFMFRIAPRDFNTLRENYRYRREFYAD